MMSSSEHPSDHDVVAEIHGEEGLLGLVKIGTPLEPLRFEPVGQKENVPKRVQTLWHLLHYLNDRIKRGGCIDDLDGTSRNVALPLSPETLVTLHRVIERIGAGRVRLKWTLANATRDGRILHIPVPENAHDPGGRSVE